MNSFDFSSGGADSGVAIAFIVFLLACFVIGILVAVLFAWLIYKPYSKLPEQHREMAPGLVFLLCVPILNLFWPFFVYSKVSGSFASYFAEKGDGTHGDAGKGLGMAWAISTVCCIVPLVNALAGLAVLVFYILYVVKVWGMGNRIGESATGSAEVSY